MTTDKDDIDAQTLAERGDSRNGHRSFELSKSSRRDWSAVGILGIIIFGCWAMCTIRHCLVRLSLAMSDHPNVYWYVKMPFKNVELDLGSPDKRIWDSRLQTESDQFVLHRPGMPWKSRTLTLSYHGSSSFSYDDARLSDWTTFDWNHLFL